MDVNFDKAEAKWIPVIGQFIFDYASIEDSLHQVLKFYLRKNIVDEDDLNVDFKVRLKLFEKIMKKEILEENDDRDTITLLIKEILNLRQTRNLIAHNAIGLTFEQDKSGQMQMKGFQISGKKNKTSTIDFPSLQKQALRLRKCRASLADLMMKFHYAEMKTLTRENTADLLRKKP